MKPLLLAALLGLPFSSHAQQPCVPAAALTPQPAQHQLSRRGLATGVASLALMGASVGTFLHAKALAEAGSCPSGGICLQIVRGPNRAAPWQTASDVLALSGLAMALVSASFFVVDF